MNIDKAISILETVNEMTGRVIRFAILPVFIPYAIIREIWDTYQINRRNKAYEAEKIKDPKYVLNKKLKAGEVKIHELPHERHEGDDSFEFFDNKDFLPEPHVFFYVSLAPDQRIVDYIINEQEKIRKWSDWWGFEIRFVDQEELLSRMCFPQDRKYLKHGLIRCPGYTRGCKEYPSLSVRPLKYYHLDMDSSLTIEQQLIDIVQEVEEERFM